MVILRCRNVLSNVVILSAASIFSSAMAQPNITQQSLHRVHIQNLAFNCSRQAVLNVIENCTGLQEVPVQIIRKPAGHATGTCSAIFSAPSQSDILRCATALNSIHPNLISNILRPGAFTLNASQAYHPGARVVPVWRSRLTAQQAASFAHPLTVPQPTGQLSSNQVQPTVSYQVENSIHFACVLIVVAYTFL